MRRHIRFLASAFIALAIVALTMSPASACGGFFCQNQPVDQVAERIVFTVNDDDTVSSLIEIAYQGEADDFSWILPIAEPIDVDDVAVPEDGELVFDELHTLTDVRIIPPEATECVDEILMASPATTTTAAPNDRAVEVFASGEVGPFGFDVVGADDPEALLTWLRDNNYRVDESMEPLIDVYVDEEFSFLAMRLLDGESADSIQPVEITYPGSQPMIPLRLTAVAAFDDMPIYVWVFGDHQAIPENYEHFEIRTEELSFSSFGFSDYTRLIGSRADALGGQAFITEYASPVTGLAFDDPYLVQKAEEQPYLTRLRTVISPAEMLTDPMFTFDAEAEDVSNVHDASDLRGLYDCERELTRAGRFFDGDALDSGVINVQLSDGTFDGYDNLRDGANVEFDPLAMMNPDDSFLTADVVVDDSPGGISTVLATMAGVLGTIVVLGLGFVIFVAGRRSQS